MCRLTDIIQYGMMTMNDTNCTTTCACFHSLFKFDTLISTIIILRIVLKQIVYPNQDKLPLKIDHRNVTFICLNKIPIENQTLHCLHNILKNIKMWPWLSKYKEEEKILFVHGNHFKILFMKYHILFCQKITNLLSIGKAIQLHPYSFDVDRMHFNH